MAKTEKSEAITEKDIKPAPSRVTFELNYASCAEADVRALWDECGRDKVKGLAGHRGMTLSAIRKALGRG